MKDELSFDLEIEEKPVILKLKGVPTRYSLRAMNGAARDAYLDAISNRMTHDAAGKPQRIKSFAGMQAELLRSCLFKEGTDTPLTVEEIQKFPAAVVTSLFEAAQVMNGLGDEAEKEAKKALEPESNGIGTE